MLNVISQSLRQLADAIDAGKFECSQEQMSALVTQLSELNGDRPLSKAQACSYLDVSRSTSDKLVKDGKLPKGQKKMGFKELSWTKEQLNQYDRK